ncbi:MAG: 4Fe-4S binding protein [Chitinispirillaceae bacterium]|nr:4Fe-4S binding protein [Chitinispirillaceae bacterium]
MSAKVDVQKCTGCGKCVEICPLEAIKIENGKAVVTDNCAECGSCIGACPNQALSL